MKILRLLFSGTLFFMGGLFLPLQAQVCDCPSFSNQVGNPYFDQGNFDFYSDCAYASVCNDGTYFVAAEGRDKCNNPTWLDNTWDYTSGNAQGRYLIVDGPENSNDLLQNIIWADYIDIVQGETFKAAFAVNPRLSQFVNTQLKLAIYVNDVNISGTINVIGYAGWQEFCYNYVGPYSGPAYYQIRQVGNFDAIGYDYGLDNIYFGNCLETQNCNLTANLNWEQDYQNCEVSFTNLSISNSATTIVGYYWEFGDGSTSTEMNPSHFYTDPGSFHACLTV